MIPAHTTEPNPVTDVDTATSEIIVREAFARLEERLNHPFHLPYIPFPTKDVFDCQG